MASLVAFLDRKLPIEIIRLLKKKRLHPEFSVLDQINELDIFKLDPSELPGLSKINSDEQAWPFFSETYKNVKGNDSEVRDKSTGKRIGGKKNYVYYKRGASPKQKIKTDWVMHEYYVDDDDSRYKVVKVVGAKFYGRENGDSW
ncbi:NAC domain-containing protein 86-like [Pistacia vera]|uniref:NAC domain-containing protein 86-like n=1 Tax=Pistacia vera TaxID=55513 RepID=UPI001263221A|nr:NAC domain-containing protein 86-like [Pistacia vera]